MGWTFLKRKAKKTDCWKKSRKSIQTLPIFSNLFCTLRGGGQPTNVQPRLLFKQQTKRSSGIRGLSRWTKRKRSSLINDDDLSEYDTLSELALYHSTVLRRPIPLASNRTGFGVGIPFPRRRVSRVMTSPPSSAFCPTCRNVVIPLPQKRTNSFINHTNLVMDTDDAYDDVFQAKRKRPCLDRGDGFPALVDTTPTGQFNPIYESVCLSEEEEDDDSIYSEVADSAASSFESLKCVDTKPPPPPRHNRLTSIPSVSDVEYEDFIDTDKDLSSNSSTACNGDSMAATYEHTIPWSCTVLASVGEPWSKSTLKRNQSSGSMYDEVATDSDFDEGEHYYEHTSSVAVTGNVFHLFTNALHPQFESDKFDKLNIPHLFSRHSNEMLKRARREYFVCEE